MHGLGIGRCNINLAAREVPGMPVAKSRGSVDATSKSEFLQLGLWSVGSGEESRSDTNNNFIGLKFHSDW